MTLDTYWNPAPEGPDWAAEDADNAWTMRNERVAECEPPEPTLAELQADLAKAQAKVADPFNGGARLAWARIEVENLEAMIRALMAREAARAPVMERAA